MKKTVKIGDKDITLVGDGFTPIAYTAQFHSDYYHDLNDAGKGIVTLFLSRVTYVMAKQASKNKSSYDDFETWLSKFEINDITLAAEEIMNIVSENGKTSSVSKKN